MTASSPGGQGRAAELRRDFDRAFGAPAEVGVPDLENLLAVRVGGDAYAFKVRELAELSRGRRVVPVPSGKPALLGLAGLRGVLVQVYDLAALLGHAAESEAPRWLVLCGGSESVALGFQHLEGYLRLPRAEVYAAAVADGAKRHLREAVRAGGCVRGVISVASILAALES
ncbi:MAG: chemotaxis protein CheW [Planctomycetes bacterium]|nr:chemotaxis protein CheW [Planctomycetota bacterium]